MTYTNNEIKDAAIRVQKFLQNNNKNPLTVRVTNDTLQLNDFLHQPQIIEAYNRLVTWIKEHGQYPNTLNILNILYNMKEYRILFNMPVINQNVNDDAVYNHFCQTFGKVNTFDEAMQKIKEHGYDYYYNDKYTNKTCIDRLKQYKGINCTDSAQMSYHIAKALGYDVKCLHVQCQSGGHVRLQLKHNKNTGGNWIHRDPACIISKNGKPLSTIWCPNAPVIAVNPTWWMNDVNR